MAKSREACSIVNPSVVVSTTSPVEISPPFHSSTDQTDLLPAEHVQREVLEHRLTARVAEAHIAKIDRPFGHDQRLRIRAIQHLVRQPEHLHRFAELRELPDHVDHRHGEVARRVQHRKSQGGGEHHIAGGYLPSAPELHRPHQHPRGDEEYRQGVELAQPLERAQAQALRLHLVLNLRAEALLLALRPAECSDQSDVAHRIGEIAAHVRRMACEVLVQLAPAGSP